MEQYTFIVQLPFKGRASYTVNLDGHVPLIESFARIVEATQGAEEEIPIEITTADGRRAEVTWTFALAGEDGDEMLLSPHMSLIDQGVMPNAEIVVEDESNVGAPDPDARFREDCVRLARFIGANKDHLKVTKQTRRQIEIQISGVRAIVSVDKGGVPVYGENHRLRILIPANYPYEGPRLVPLTEVFHPNIAYGTGEANVCYTEGYVPDGDDTFSYMIYQWLRMVQYRRKGWNLQEPHRHQNEIASRWLEEVLKAPRMKNLLPVKPVIDFHWA